MAYLDIQFSKQEMGIVVDNIPIETEQPASNVNDATDSAENSNFQIARKLKDEKFKIVVGVLNAILHDPRDDRHVQIAGQHERHVVRSCFGF